MQMHQNNLKCKQSLPQYQQNSSNLQIPKKVNENRYKSFFLSGILGDIPNQNSQQINPQYIRIKNNVLTFLFGLSAYGLYYLIGNFIDYLVLGYVAGVAYHQIRTKFVMFVLASKKDKIIQNSAHRMVKFIYVGVLLLLIFILPRIRQLLGQSPKATNIFDIKQSALAFYTNQNFSVIICQIFAGLYCCSLLIGPQVSSLVRNIHPKNPTSLKWVFGLLVIGFTIFTIVFIPTVLFKQVGKVGVLIQQKIQQKLQCKIISLNSNDLPLCSQKLTSESILIKSSIELYRSQNQTAKVCKLYIQKLQQDYFGSYIFNYDDIVCTWYSIIINVYNISIIQEHTQDISKVDIFNTSTNIFKILLGNIAKIILKLTDGLFCFSIFITIFILTVQTQGRYLTIKNFFSDNKQELINSISNLMEATGLIVIWHFIVSYILLEIFYFTPVNLILATLLSLMAFIPFFRPWFGVLFFSILRIVFLGQYTISIIFLCIYYLISQKIYSFYYSQIQINEIIINMSVLFGIYGFGISGIFYGPLIVIIYSCIQKELFVKYHNQEKVHQQRHNR